MIFKDSKNESTALRDPGTEANLREENATFPLGTSDGAFDADSSLDPLAGAETVKRSSAGTLLIIAVIVIAAGGLFSMRFLAKVNASSSTDGEVEKNISQFLALLDGGTGPKAQQSVLFQSDTTVLNVLKESYTEHQVPLENLAKDPFNLSGGETPVANTDPGDSSTHQWEQHRREKLQAMEQASKNLQLTSVLLGGTPLANINGKILRVGEVLHMDKQGVDFRITNIETDKATLVGEDAALNVKYEVTVVIDRD